ncbi:MAG: hypothetical protein QXR44_06075 [Thermoproteota archaeon]
MQSPGQNFNVEILVSSDIMGEIDPKTYGHFIEHLGRCIYGGVWVGENSLLPNFRGLRLDVLEATRTIKPPIIRWPGGNFASGYLWKDGIGPRDKRPIRTNPAWGGLEPNKFGTDGFIDFNSTDVVKITDNFTNIDFKDDHFIYDFEPHSVTILVLERINGITTSTSGGNY